MRVTRNQFSGFVRLSLINFLKGLNFYHSNFNLHSKTVLRFRREAASMTNMASEVKIGSNLTKGFRIEITLK